MKAILFDLDGTLLPMNTKKFHDLYFSSLGNYFDDLMNKEEFVESVWIATLKMLNDETEKQNKVIFENEFKKHVSDLELYMERFNNYYETEFEVVKGSTSEEPIVKKIIKMLKDKGYLLILATNPLFPLNAVEKRIEWAGLDHEDFVHITHFENSNSCKPNKLYYENILRKFNLESSDCYMVGNDVSDDMVAKNIGLKTFLLTPHILNMTNDEPTWDHEGDYGDLFNWADELPYLEKGQ